jgi:hypothetical protein
VAAQRPRRPAMMPPIPRSTGFAVSEQSSRRFAAVGAARAEGVHHAHDLGCLIRGPGLSRCAGRDGLTEDLRGGGHNV